MSCSNLYSFIMFHHYPQKNNFYFMSPDWKLYVLKLIGIQRNWSHIPVTYKWKLSRPTSCTDHHLTLRINISYKSQANMWIIYRLLIVPMLWWKDLETAVGTSHMDLIQEIKPMGEKKKCATQRGLWTHREVRCRGCVCLIGGGWRTCLDDAIQMWIDDCSCIISCK